MGIFEEQNLLSPHTAPTADVAGALLRIQSLIEPFRARLQTVAVASVNPPLLSEIDSFLRDRQVSTVIIGRDVAVPVDNLTDEPDKVGTDRLLNALSAFKRFRVPVMIVDAGTATTIDVVDQYGRFLGGAILPGPRAVLDAMHRTTAALPHISMEEAMNVVNGPRGLPEIARNTRDAMIAGAAWSTIGAIEALRAIYEKHVGPVKLIGTGGAIGFVPKKLGIFDAVLPYLALEGIALSVA
jgi:type III pantothenate kinase